AARRDLELPVDLAQMELDRPRAQEQRCRRFLVARSGGDKSRDLELLRREVVDRARPLLRMLAARTKLAAHPLRPRVCSELLEELERRPKFVARLAAFAFSAKTFASVEPHARDQEWRRRNPA